MIRYSLTRVLFTTLLIAFISNLSAQTSVIFHRSHSTSMSYFNPMTIDDNLGWTGFERPTHFVPDTTVFFATQTQIADTTGTGPYCTNPNLSQDSINKQYPFYASSMPDTATQSQKPWKEDTLAKPREKIRSRNDVNKNEVDPTANFYGETPNPPSPGILFVSLFLVLMTAVGYSIWLTNRHKMAA